MGIFLTKTLKQIITASIIILAATSAYADLSSAASCKPSQAATATVKVDYTTKLTSDRLVGRVIKSPQLESATAVKEPKKASPQQYVCNTSPIILNRFNLIEQRRFLSARLSKVW